jgi:hypothetical protein
VGRRRQKPEDTYLDTKTSEFVCKGCGAREKLELPRDILLVAKDAKAFGTAHRHCVAPTEAARG